MPRATSRTSSVEPIVKLRRIASFPHEFLDALAFVRFTRVQVTARVHGDAADTVELPGIPAAAANRGAGRLQRVTVENNDFLVVTVGDEQKPLLRVVRERHVPHRSVAGGVLGDDPFLHELAVLLEHLDAIVLPVADVDHAVLRDLDAAERAELLRGRSVGIVAAGIGVGWLLAVGAPAAFEGSGGGVKYRNAV